MSLKTAIILCTRQFALINPETGKKEFLPNVLCALKYAYDKGRWDQKLIDKKNFKNQIKETILNVRTELAENKINQ